MNDVMYLRARDSDAGYRIAHADLDTVEANLQPNSNYEVTFTLTYTDKYKRTFNAAKAKADVYYKGEIYNIQQADPQINKEGLLQMKVTANHSLIDKMKNLRVDKKYPTEAQPDVSGGSSQTSDKPQQPGVVTKQTDVKETYPLDDRLNKFFNNNDQGIKYELHGDFPKVAVDVQDTSLFDWLNQNLKSFNAYYIPRGNTLHIYDVKNLRHETGRQFRYQYNMNNADLQIDVNSIVNDCDVYGGKMEKDITSGGGGGGNLDSAEGFAKSAINADFGVNKGAMLNNFAARSQRVHAWGVDVNRLYDVVKASGVSPEWFFAYELQEQGTGWGWLNHTYRHGDPYQDAQSVCNWIKQCANSASINPAWSAPEGSMAPNPALAAKWNQEFGNGSIGRCYLQGTAAAVWDLAGVTPNPAIGKPVTGCMNQIKAWGGHSGNTEGANQVAAFLKSFVGKVPYVWSGTTPSGWDCSGMMNYVLSHFGIPLPSARPVTTTLETMGSVVNPPYQTGDLLFWGARGNSYHVSMAVDSEWRVGADNDHDGTVLRKISQWPPSFAVRVPKMAQFVGGQNASNGGDSLSTETQSYYALYFHYEDKDSIKKYGRHRGKPVVCDSIYDMKLLQEYVNENVQHDPKTTLTLNDINETDFNLGDVWRVIIPELNFKEPVTLLGIKYKPFNHDKSDATLTFNNTGLTQNIINALYQDIRGINGDISQFNTLTTLTQPQENHFGNIVTLSATDMEKLKVFTEGG